MCMYFDNNNVYACIVGYMYDSMYVRECFIVYYHVHYFNT